MRSELLNAAATRLERAAERLRAGEDDGVDWLSVTPDCAHECHEMLDAKAQASEWMDLDGLEDEWHEDIESVSWGVYVPVEVATQTDRRKDPDGHYDFLCDYSLEAP